MSEKPEARCGQWGHEPLCGCQNKPEAVGEALTHLDRDVMLARSEISRLCKGGTAHGSERWRMTIPVDEYRDSDCIFSRVVGHIAALRAALAAKTEECEFLSTSEEMHLRDKDALRKNWIAAEANLKKAEDLIADPENWYEMSDRLSALTAKLKKAEEERDRLRQRCPCAHKPGENHAATCNAWTLCSQCGYNVDVDEDGCCVTCGSDALQLYAANPFVERDAAEAEVEKWKATATEHYEESLDLGKRYKTEIDAAEAKLKKAKEETQTSVTALLDMLVPIDTLTLRNSDNRERIGRARVHLDAWQRHLEEK